MSKVSTTVKTKTEATNKTVMIFIGLAAAAIVCSGVISNALWQSLSFETRYLSEKQKVEATLQSNADVLPELENAFAALQTPGIGPTEEKVLHALPDEFDFAELGTNLEQLAIVSGVQLVAIDHNYASFDVSQELDGNGDVLPEDELPEDDESTAIVSEIPLTITMEGSFADIQKAIRNLETSLLPYKINSISFSASETRVSADISLTTYFQPAETVEFTTREFK